MLTDLRNAIRGFRNTPAFTAVALVILALGIGATTAIFSVVDAVVLRGLPFPEADRLVSVGQRSLSTGEPGGSEAPQNFLDWRRDQKVLEGLAAITGGQGHIVRSGGEGREIRTRRVSYEFFSVLGVQPMLGGPWTADQEVEGRHQVAMLSYAFWQQQFGGDPNVVGRTLALDNGTFEVAGIMPASFAYPLGLVEPVEMWVPYVVPPSERTRGTNYSYYLQLIGRLKPGVSIAQAEAQLAQVTAPIATQFPEWFRDTTMSVRSLHESLVGRVRPWMMLLLGVVAFVLVLACVNVANLLLARGTSRQRELGVRAALGASRWQIARGLLVESISLSLTGALLGLVVAWTGAELLKSAMPATLPRLADIAIDLRVLTASMAAAMTTGVLFGLLPAFQFSRPDLTGTLRDGGRSATTGVAKQRLRAALVIGEVALAVVLLVGSGLFISSFGRVMAIDLGLDRERVLTLPVPLGNLQRLNEMTAADRKAVADRTRQSLESVLVSVQAVPGVERAALMSGAMPLTGSSNTTSARTPSTGREFPGRSGNAEIKRVTPDYHAALGIPLKAGRYFTADDRAGGAPVVLLNEAAASLYFDGTPALGQSIDINGVRTVVGIVGSVRQNGPESAIRPEAYVPLSQTDVYNGSLVVRTTGSPVTILPAVKRAVLRIVPAAVFPASRTLEQYLDALVAQRRFNMRLFSLFGVLGLVIAVVGIYGVMTYNVEQRTAEFGVRMALGAAPARILAMVVARAGLFMAAGLAAGVTGASLLSRFVGTFLFEVQPGEPRVYASVAMILAIVGIVAALVPALRASRVDPIIALRSQ